VKTLASADHAAGRTPAVAAADTAVYRGDLTTLTINRVSWPPILSVAAAILGGLNPAAVPLEEPGNLSRRFI